MKEPAPFIELGEDSKELPEDFDFSGAFKMSEQPPGQKSEKGRTTWIMITCHERYYKFKGHIHRSITKVFFLIL